MTRLTEYCEDTAVVTSAKGKVCSSICLQRVRCENCPIGDALNKLATYEDTGLTPERCAELAQAEQEGWLVWFPCKVGENCFIPIRSANKVLEITVSSFDYSVWSGKWTVSAANDAQYYLEDTYATINAAKAALEAAGNAHETS